MKASSIIIGAALALSVLLNVFLLTREQPIELMTITESDTIYVHDTVRIDRPVPVWEELMYIDTVWLEKVVIDEKDDTMRVSNRLADGHTNGRPKSTIKGFVNDSVPVLIPITERTFKNDHYKAVVSGFDPRLVSLDIYQHTKTVMVTKTKNPRVVVSAGIYGGFGVKGADYGLGISVGVPIWSW